MSDPLDMSLDDLVKQQRIKKPRVPRGKGDGAGAAAANSGKPYQRKPRAAGSGMYADREDAGFAKAQRGDNMWPHDKFGGKQQKQQQQQQQQQFKQKQPRNMQQLADVLVPAGRLSGAHARLGPGAKMTVSNLHFRVTDGDVEELFGSVGELLRATILYDREGMSTGNAEVVFLKRGDAVRAMNKYNGVALDGRPMHISIAGEAAHEAPAPRESKAQVGAMRARGALKPTGARPAVASAKAAAAAAAATPRGNRSAAGNNGAGKAAPKAAKAAPKAKPAPATHDSLNDALDKYMSADA